MSEENMKQVKKTHTANAPEKSVKKKKKKKKGGRVSVALAAVLLVIALLFGVIAGYAFGRNTGHARLKAAQSQIDELSDAYEESSRNDDVFDAEMDVGNEEALNDLAGAEFEPVGNDLLGGDELTEEMEETTGEPVVVAEFDGGKVLSDEAAQAYEEEIARYAFAGYTEEEISGDLMGEVLSELVTDKVLRAKAEELGLDELSPEDEQEMAKLAQEDYESTVLMVEDLLREEGVAEEEIRDAAMEYLEQDEGITYDTVLKECRDEWWMSKLYDETTKDVAASDADIEAAYNELVQSQKESFAANAEDYEYARMNGDMVAYNPAGYRAVREMLVEFDEETLLRVFELNDQIASMDASKQAEEIAQLEEELAECYADADTRAMEALEQLRAGADFDEVLRAANPDSDAVEELSATVYPIREGSQYWPENVIGAAMALENVGDFSEPIHVENGVVILVYDGEIAEGAVPLEEIREALREELLESMQYGAYKTQVDEWVSAANPKYYPDRMQ